MDLTVSDAPVGRLLDGRYRVEAALARGGMATVYRALDMRLDRIVALKVMHPELTVDDEFVAAFIGEARSAARLSHPNVVSVFDQGQDDGVVFLAMEYVEGSTLRHVLRERGPLTPAQALAMLEPVLSALSAAHEAGIAHRDVKPENVLVGENGRIKVADFGLARALADSGTGSRGVLLGTVNYISPEQAQGAPATPRSDVYSAGVMLYELLTGVPPHSGGTDADIVRSHIERDVPPPSAMVPAIPPAVDELVQRATAREPRERFADAAAFGEAARTTMTAIGAPVPGLEERGSAGVTVTEALSLGDLESRDGNGPGHTTIIPVPSTAPAAPAPARRPTSPPSRHGRRESGSRRKARRRRDRTGAILLVLALLVAVAVVAGAWWLGEGRYTTVPPLAGLTYEQAQQEAEEAGLRVRRDGTEHSESIEAGRIVRTEPATADRILRGRYIGLIMSEGAERFEVPDLRGHTEEEAVEALEELNLVADVEEQFHDTVEEGVVIGQGVDPGERLRADEQVPVYVSKGRQPIEIVDYTGQNADQAQQALADAGFEVVREQRPPNGNVRPGFVISQEPNSGTGYGGDTITLYVASDDARIPVPDVVGMQVDEAQRQLAEAGFTNVKVDGRLLFWRDTVVEQRPRPGQEIKPDQQIELRTR